MHATYKNLTDKIQIVGDLGIKFMPRGKKGDVVDLTTLFPLATIRKSIDLQNMLMRSIVAPVGRVVRGAPPPKQNPQRSLANPGPFVVRQPAHREPLPEGKGVVWDAQQKKALPVPAKAPVRAVEVPRTQVAEPVEESFELEPMELEPMAESAQEVCAETVCKSVAPVTPKVEEPFVLQADKCAYVKPGTNKQCKKKPAVGTKLCYFHTEDSI